MNNKLDIELEQLNKWYSDEGMKILSIYPSGLDGPLEGMMQKLDKQFLEKRVEILNKYGVKN